ncbi:AT-hook motif nuclear-localized protein 28-like [Lolium perenne]|uniref:AT-hook motif nuclear-localized protein 28-like n=1 Tax=Lolium perenne TaxID=4522 RepID=UPI0021F5645C|nr:AT-hook motif nuclear-localized protein 18-like [Lolium perenne]
MADNDATTLAELLEPAQAPELVLLPQELPPATPASVGRRRGRPPGSRNKEKPPVVIVRESKAAMRPVVLELAAGCDVATALADFARRRCVGVSVLCGRGALSAVALRLSTSPVTLEVRKLEGRLEVLSLSGTVLPSNAAGDGGVQPPPFTVALAGGGGQVIGGTLAGVMTVAEDGMVVVAATFGTAEVHRVPAHDSEEERGDDGRPEERHPPPPPPPPPAVALPPPQLLQLKQAMVGASAAADVGHVAAYGEGSGWRGGYPGQVGHYQQQHADQTLPWAQLFADSGAPNYHYL